MNTRLALIAAMLLPAISLAQSPFDGIWRPDPEIPGEPNKPAISTLANGVYACKTCEPPYQVKADGHDQAVKDNPNAESVAVAIIDARTVMKTVKVHGMTFASKISVSSDGSARTEVQTITGMAPVPVELTAHFTRLGEGPPKSHAISGSWHLTLTELSNYVEDTTLKISDGVLSMSDRMGRSFSAKLDGTQAPYLGTPEFNGVSVKLIDADTIEESDLKDGTPVKITRWTVAADGQSMHARFDDTHGRIQNQTGHKISAD